MTIINDKLIDIVCSKFSLNLSGIHGLSHWARVYDNGFMLAEGTDANLKVIACFALFHDSCRQSDSSDPKHGDRGARLAAKLRGEHLSLTDNELLTLQTACNLHTRERIHSDPTVQICFDSDRLDLDRVGNTPHPFFLNTSKARDPDIMHDACLRSRSNFVPHNILGEAYHKFHS